MKKVTKILGIGLLVIIACILGILAYVSFALPDVGPPPNIEIEQTAERVERGKHLANNVMVCMHCHTPIDKAKFAHPLKVDSLGAGGVYFGPEEGLPGVFYSPNITPAALGDWTDGEIYRAITSGVNKDGRALFPIMPHPNYGKIEKEDIYSIIAYLRTLEPIENKIPEQEISFPMNFIINTIPKPAEHTLVRDTTDPIKWGEYLVTAGSCSDCHSPREKGAIIPGMEFAGGAEFPLIDGSIVRTSNITPDEITGIGRWTETDFIKRFKDYADSSFNFARVADDQFNTAMPWQNYSKMSEEELKAIYAYLQTVKPVENEVKRFTSVLESDSE
ncbi:c-type cytochrome [Gracilimonas sp.]|uniref:c-type cytochrome n=1 Tax=Gracilimonas sp. TaxID=1974203 RepID=UPI002870B836|nr:c-type cytochrome [Gracilimonas sp.]